MTDHILYKPESTFGTFNSSSMVAVQLVDATPTANENRLESRLTGEGRGLHRVDQGSQQPSGTFTIRAAPEIIGDFIKAACFNTVTKSTPATATNTRAHAFSQDDTAAFDSLSLQFQQVRGGTTICTNVRGAVINRLQVAANVDEYVTITCDYLAVEEEIAGGTFGDGNSSPAAQAVSYATAVVPFLFQNISFETGGTVAKDGTSKIVTLGSSTALTGVVESATVTVENGIAQRLVLGNRFTNNMTYGDRVITVDLTFNDDDPRSTEYTKHLAGTQEAFRMLMTGATIEGSFTTELDIILPLADYMAAPFGQLSASNDGRSRDVQLRGIMEDTTSDQDIAIKLQDDNDTGY